MVDAFSCFLPSFLGLRSKQGRGEGKRKEGREGCAAAQAGARFEGLKERRAEAKYREACCMMPPHPGRGF